MTHGVMYKVTFVLCSVKVFDLRCMSAKKNPRFTIGCQEGDVEPLRSDKSRDYRLSSVMT